MSRPTDVTRFSQADQWMRETFGSGMKDYLTSERKDLISVAVVEVEKVIRKAAVRQLLVQWRADDVKSAAGIQAILSTTDALTLILLQLRLRRVTMITELGETYLQLSDTHRKILGMKPHDGNETAVYSRVWEAIQRLIALIDEFPGRRDKVFTEEEFAKVLAARNPEDCEMRRERMFTLSNALLEGSRLCLPQEIRDRSHGNIALDATVAAIYGKAGNRSSKNPEGDRRTCNPDAGWYGRGGTHGAFSQADADHHNSKNPNDTVTATAASKRLWGVELEIARMTANFREDNELFPLLSVGVSFHIPGAIKGEALRIAQSLIERNHPANLFIVDRAYPNGKVHEYAVPLRLLGFKHVFSYKENQIGVQAHDPRGFVQISGAWYLDTVPLIQREADLVIFKVREKWFNHSMGYKRAPEGSTARKAHDVLKKETEQAETLYASQFARREKSRLMPKGKMTDDWTRRYLVPPDSPDYKRWKAKPGTHQGVTVTMQRPNEAELTADPNAGGYKTEQYYPWGGPEWLDANGMRNGVESVNANVKRPQFEDVGEAAKRAVRGNTFTYLVGALALVSENLRKMIKFFKKKLVLHTLTAKNDRLPSIFWQSPNTTTDPDEDDKPPG
jgi:hypothetical protein